MSRLAHSSDFHMDVIEHRQWARENRPLRVLIGCECSGVVRRAFRFLGHDAWSCDIQPADDGSCFHIQDDVRNHFGRGWDIGIFHPVCRFLANSGVKHLYIGGRKENGPNPERWENMRKAREFFMECLNAPIENVAVENPIPHGHANLGEPTQIIQPWMFGHPEKKATALWLRGRLCPLTPTNDVRHLMKDLPKKMTDRVHYMPPGPDREKLRSETYAGIAAAMASQWGAAVIQEIAA